MFSTIFSIVLFSLSCHWICCNCRESKMNSCCPLERWLKKFGAWFSAVDRDTVYIHIHSGVFLYPLPGMAVAPPSTVRLHRWWWKLLSTSTGQNCHPWRTSTPSGVGRRPTGSLKTPTTPATNCSACCHPADGTAASDPAPPGSGTTSSLRLLLSSQAHYSHFTSLILY